MLKAINNGFRWLDRHGQLLSDEKLKADSKTWDYGTWQKFLDWMEVPLGEVLISPSLYDYLSDGLEVSVFELFGNETKDISQPDLNVLLRHLTKKQRQVIKLTFWERLSEREVANRLKISRATVRDLKCRGLRKLKSVTYVSGINCNPCLRYKTTFGPSQHSSQQKSSGYEIDGNFAK